MSRLKYHLHSLVDRPRRLGLVSSGRVTDVALIIAVLCMSGNPTFSLGRTAVRSAGSEMIYAVAAALLACALLLRRGDRAVRAFLPIGAVFAVLFVVQAYAFDFFPIITVMGFFTRLFIGMAVVIIVSDFVRAYIVTTIGLSLLSFVFWVPEFITCWSGMPFHNFFRPLALRLGSQPGGPINLGFHTFLTDPQQMHRNAGIFWEPGAFAGYIIIALLMLAAIRPSLTRKRHLAVLCTLTGALLSTFSTAGYIAYPVALLLNYNWRRLDRRHRAGVALGAFLIALLLILGSSYAFSQLDFLGAKIRRQLTVVERHEYGWHITRFGTLVFDWEYISRRPLTGWGLHQKTRYALHPWAREHGFGNGMSNFLANFGVIGFGTFLLGLGRGAMHIGGKSRGYVIGFIASTLLVLQGEPFLGFPFFLGLMFLGHASVMGQRMPYLQLTDFGSPVRARRRFSLQPTEL